MELWTLVLFIISAAIYAASRLHTRGGGLAIFSAILAASSALAVLADQDAADYQIVLIAVSDVYIFLSSILYDRGDQD